MPEIYLDSAAMHKVLPVAREAFLSAPFGNPSSEHAVGQAARDALENARERIARCISAPSESIFFTSGATESCQWAMHTLYRNCAAIDTGDTEHHAVSEYRWNGDGKPVRECFESGCAQMLGQNEVGTIFDVKKLHEKYNLVFTDATAAMGHIPVDVSDVDLMAFSGHKFGGVLGAGVLYAKDPAILSPLIRGGGQERGMRSGTENVPAICAMAAALEWQCEHMNENMSILNGMRFFLINKLLEIKGSVLNTPYESAETLPHIINISFPGVDAHALALLLSKEGVMVSPGAACSNGLHEPSHVILAMFHDEHRARSAIRISLSHENTVEECQYAAENIKECVAYLRSLA